jgi:hypothetical protein
MRGSREQIVAMLKQAEVGVPVAELIRQVGSASKRCIAGRSSTVKHSIRSGEPLSRRDKNVIVPCSERLNFDQNASECFLGKRLKNQVQ